MGFLSPCGLLEVPSIVQDHSLKGKEVWVSDMAYQGPHAHWQKN